MLFHDLREVKMSPKLNKILKGQPNRYLVECCDPLFGMDSTLTMSEIENDSSNEFTFFSSNSKLAFLTTRLDLLFALCDLD